MKRLNIGLDDKTRIKLKLISITEGKPVSSIVREAIIKLLGEYKWDVRSMPEDMLKIWLDMMPQENMDEDDKAAISKVKNDELIPDNKVLI
jgi:hypothetical protein